MVGHKNKKTSGYKVSKLVFIITVSVLFFLSLRLREYKYAEVPLPGETLDEYSFGWLGISLIKDKFPTAWSGIGGYKFQEDKKINVDKLYDLHPEWPAFPINKPWFDHPPAFGLLIGGYAYGKGIRDFEDASVIILRRPMLKIGAVSSILVFLLAYVLFGYFPALISGAIYSVSPLIVISSRLVLAENGYIPLFLLAVLGTSYYLKTKTKRYWYLGIACASVALLFKLSAASIFVSLFILSIYFSRKERKFMITTLIVSVSIAILAFCAYGYYFDWEVFRNIILSNSNRFYGVGAEIFYSAFSQTKVTGSKYLSDGWIVASWISFFAIASKTKLKEKSAFVTVPIFSSLGVLIIMGSEAYGWYRFPILPFLIICLGKTVYDLYKNQNFLYFLLLLLPFGTIVHRLIRVEGFQRYVLDFRLGIMIIFILFLFTVRSNDLILKLSRNVVMIFLLIFLLYLSIKLVYFYTPGRWIFAT